MVLKLLSETFHIIRTTQRNIIHIHTGCSFTRLFLPAFNQTTFLDRYSKNSQISDIMKVRSVGAEFHADGQTDMHKVRHDEANSRFSQFL
jgi:hypothetical protein